MNYVINLKQENYEKEFTKGEDDSAILSIKKIKNVSKEKTTYIVIYEQIWVIMPLSKPQLLTFLITHDNEELAKKSIELLLNVFGKPHKDFKQVEELTIGMMEKK